MSLKDAAGVVVVMAVRAAVMGSKFALAIFIAHYLDLASLGLYGLAAGAIAIVPVSVNIGMNHVLMRAAVGAPMDQLVDSLRQYWTFVSGVYAVLLALSVLCHALFGTETIWILLVAVIFFEHVGNDVFYLFSNLQRHLAANILAFIRGSAWVLVYVPLAMLYPGLRTLPCLFQAWLIGCVLSMLVFVVLSRAWPWRQAFAAQFRVSFVTGIVRRSYLFYISDLSFVASQYVDRYLVTLFLGIKVAGIYFLFWTVANATTTFLALVFQQKQRPLLIHAYGSGGVPAHRALAWRFMQISVVAAFALSTVIALAFQLALPWLGQAALAGQMSAFWLIVVGMAVRYMADYAAMAMFSAHQDRLTTITNVASIVALIVAQLALLPVAGLYGAGAAILATSAAVLAWRYCLLFGAPLAWRRAGAPASAAPIGTS